ncbi:acyltransferase family protein [Marinobacter sp. M1N3S26]|uniref:acyltransferase family protein n=1 Tax=unclassified Marinobacter TaxID=83889 RepID=UPI00387B98A8
MDTLRSVAILIVVFAHSILGFGSPPLLAPFQLGGMGVDLFFVLSGWLLGSQLFKEMESGEINVQRFWIRRWMRTLPAYYVVLLYTMAQQVLTKESPATPWTYFFFLQNYDYPLEIFSVSWSLAVEEQFYLFIAPFLAFTIYFRPNTRLAMLLLIFILPSVFRYFEWYGTTSETHVRLDCCIMGVLLACLKYQHRTIWNQMLKYSGHMALLATGFFILYFYQRFFPLSWLDEPGFVARALMFGAWVVYANSSPKVSWNLYFPGANYVATRSYAIYLLHPDAIAIANRLPIELPFVVYLSLVLVLSALAAEALYRAVELPFMNMRSKVRLAT